MADEARALPDNGGGEKAARKAARKQKPEGGTPVRDDHRSATFPIVGVGASAGGLKAFLRFLGGLPSTPGVAIIFVLHQEKHESALVEVVGRATGMPVEPVADGVVVQPDHVYVGVADRDVIMNGGRLAVYPPRTGHGMPIDAFFHSLADDQGSRAIGVLLSGAGSDGMLGAKAIKAEAGITFAQDDSAEFAQMPQAAIAQEAIDFVLAPEAIAREIVRIAHHAHVTGTGARMPERDLLSVFAMLHELHDVDFTNYKPTTIERRIRRRMAVHKVDDIGEYVRLLRNNPREVESLYNDLLIRVTGFFRDPDVFTTFARDILPDLVRDRDAENPVRIWVPGCATGEEVYSLAILLLEAMAGSDSCPIQIFGTDISDEAVDRARLGIYPENIAGEVSEERLRRFFTKGNGTYRVTKAVRECCVFARQNVTRDPPFSRLDLVSCRNVMIYLGNALQRKVMSIFHYALRSEGYLLLGSSETIGNFGELFSVVDRKHKIYQKKISMKRPKVDFEAPVPPARVERPRLPEDSVSAANVFREADRLMLQRFSPPGVLINENLEILQFRGRTSHFLEPPAGAASFNILKMAREGLLSELRAAIHTAGKKEAPVRREGLHVRTNGGMAVVNIEVVPFITAAKERYQIILFEELEPVVEEKKPGRGRKASLAADVESDTRQAGRLKRELEATREYLQSIIEEQEAMNEELRSANEEIQSSNEELQSTNEELETAKEELQSSNEELTTLNEELETRNQELADANNDLVNLLASVDLPIVMLDSNLRIRRFNPGAQRTLNLIASDVGRSIDDLKTTLILDDLGKLVADVIENLEVRELQVQDRRGQWYSMRIRPYKTTDHKIDGAVLVLIDLGALKKK
jgi:two-component system CheB/CheR fusion protein